MDIVYQVPQSVVIWIPIVISVVLIASSNNNWRT